LRVDRRYRKTIPREGSLLSADLANRIDLRVREWVRPFWYERVLRRRALTGLVWRTNNFSNVTWLGHPIWQNPLDAWGIQEVMVGDGVDCIVECGTNRGGSALYMASIFDLLGRGHVVTVDVKRLTDLEHPRVDFVIGSSVDPDIVAHVVAKVKDLGANNTMLMLDSDHAGPHVLRELEMYADLVPIGGHILVQDGCIDELHCMRADRPGPLWAVKKFVAADRRFVVDEERSSKFLLSHSPSGWLRRVA
jgi:cephalosporin hydroxylase